MAFPTMKSAGPVIATVAARFERDLDACFERIELHVRSARARGAKLVVFPECTLGGYMLEPRPAEVRLPEPPPAVRLDGPEVARLAELAGPTVLCVGLTEEAPGGAYSTGVCVSGDGVLGIQRKVHVPPAEALCYRPGEGFAPDGARAGSVRAGKGTARRWRPTAGTRAGAAGESRSGPATAVR